MPIARKFLDWNQPALPAAVEYLQQRYQEGGTLDLDRVVLVVPGGRAGRRLLELLAELAEANSLLFFPPRICTVGALPELLYEPQRPFANDLTQQLAWVRALRAVDRQRCRRFIPTLPAEQDFSTWMELAGLLSQQHRELAADGLNFSDVVVHGQQMDGFPETDRWKLLSDVQQRYLQTLDALGLWDLQTARLVAIDNGECRTELDIVMVATSDMNRATRRMLDQVADRVTAIIHAPAQLSDRFDEHGCLLPNNWQDVPIDLATEQVEIADGPADQANSVVHRLAGLAKAYRRDQIVIGVPDEQLVPQLQRTLQQVGVPSRWVVGRSLPDTAPYKLLSAIAAYLSRGRFADFAALVRHPDVYGWLESQDLPGDWLTELDEYYNDHLPVRPGNWLGSARGTALLQRLHAALETALQPLRGEPHADQGESVRAASQPNKAAAATRQRRLPGFESTPDRDPLQPLAAWSEPIRQVLLVFYGGTPLDTLDPQHHYTIKSLSHLRTVLLGHNQVPPEVSPSVSATDAISLVLQQLAGTKIPSPPDDQAIELLGWLELPLDEAPALVVTSFNEGHVPKSVSSDLFLPNTLRQKLGLLDNARRYARDAYALSVLVASRQELTLIAGRYTGDNDPLTPSRLAFATDNETIAQRALAFFRTSDSKLPSPAFQMSPGKQSTLIVPRPMKLQQPITTLSVTAFRSYLACPYRFYLSHVLRLSPLDDEAQELDAPTFGNVIHEVLRQFGEHEVRNSTDASSISTFLKRAARRYIDRTYGKHRPPAVDVQSAQLQDRLAAFAAWQADWAAQGWRIKHVEATCDEPPAELYVDAGQTVTLRGRIDRIDYHPEKKQWAVFDYKTSDTAKPPDKMHRQGGEWIDLQLPLYRHLISSLGIDVPVQLGYIVLPKDVSKTGALLAEWDEQTLAEADEVALQVASDIVNERFWPPASDPPKLMAEFAAICQDNAYRPQIEVEQADPAGVKDRSRQ